MTDSIIEDRLVIIALAVVLTDGEPEGAAPGWVKPGKPPVVDTWTALFTGAFVVEARTALDAGIVGVASGVDVSSMGE